MLIYTQSAIYDDYMALELRNGAIYYSYDLGAGSIFINPYSALNKYDDDMNHTVSHLLIILLFIAICYR